MSKLVLLNGPPAVGKSTLARRYADVHPLTLGLEIDTVRALRGAWLEDWQRLVAARDAYARSLAAGRPTPMTLPSIDGRGLVERLNNVGLNCRVPLVLLAP